MNIKMHDIIDMNETEITDFSEISSRIEVLVGAREPFENFRKKPDSQGSTGNSRSSSDYSHLHVAHSLLYIHIKYPHFGLFIYISLGTTMINTMEESSSEEEEEKEEDIIAVSSSLAHSYGHTWSRFNDFEISCAST